MKGWDRRFVNLRQARAIVRLSQTKTKTKEEMNMAFGPF
jgi:hypothetical protein